MIGVVIEQAFMSRRALRQPAPVRLRRLCTLTCKPFPGVSAMHVDVQSPLPSSCPFPWCFATHDNVQSSRHPLRQRVLHVDVQSAAAHVAGELHVDVQSPFLLLQEILSGDLGSTKEVLHVDVQSSRHPLRQRVLHVDVHSVAAPAVDGLHVDVQSPFVLFREIRPDSIGATEMSLHVNVQRLRRNRQRWAGALSPHSKQKASRQLRPRQNLGLSHFGARK